MKTIVGARIAGKSTEAVKLAYDTGAAIICPTGFGKQHLFELCRDMFGKMAAERMAIYTVSDIINGKYRGRNFNGFVIDDGDFVFQELLSNFVPNTGFMAQFLTSSREIVRDDFEQKR